MMQLAECLYRGEYRIDLKVGKYYRVAEPEANDHVGAIRIIDGSNEDYLYPSEWFRRVRVGETLDPTNLSDDARAAIGR